MSRVDRPPQRSAARATPAALRWRRFSGRWPRHAQARTRSLHDPAPFQREMPDFVESLLPFAKHPGYQDAGEASRTELLTCAWLIYNAKQIELERSVVMPACLDLLGGTLPGAETSEARLVVAEALTDEGFHILMLDHASEAARRRRGLSVKTIPACYAVERLSAELALPAEPWERRLLVFAAAVVSEVFICSYLRQIASSQTIQPMHAGITHAHLQDELGHGSIFRALVRDGYQVMSRREKACFIDALPKAVAWFDTQDVAPWHSVLDQLEFPARRELINDCFDAAPAMVDFTPLFKLCDELQIVGIRDRALEHCAQEAR